MNRLDSCCCIKVINISCEYKDISKKVQGGGWNRWNIGVGRGKPFREIGKGEEGVGWN